MSGLGPGSAVVRDVTPANINCVHCAKSLNNTSCQEEGCRLSWDKEGGQISYRFHGHNGGIGLFALTEAQLERRHNYFKEATKKIKQSRRRHDRWISFTGGGGTRRG